MSGDVPEKRVVGVAREDCSANPGMTSHTIGVELDSGEKIEAATAIAEIHAHEAHYTMIPPEGAPAYEAWQRTGLPLIIQTRACPDCGREVLFA